MSDGEQIFANGATRADATPPDAQTDAATTANATETATSGDWTAQDIAAALGGKVDPLGVLAPKEGHSAADRSLRVMIGPQFWQGYFVCSVIKNDSDDPMRMLAYVQRMCPFLPKRGAPSAPLTKEEREALEARRREQEAKRATERARRLEFWRACWKDAAPVAPVEREMVGGASKALPPVNAYLENRGVDVPLGVFRCTRLGSARRNAFAYGMLARIVDPATDEGLGAHVTFLSHNGFKTKWRGHSRMTPCLTGDKGCGVIKLIVGNRLLCIGEGIETALSFLRIPEAKGATIWSGVTAANMANLAVLDDFDAILIAVDIERLGAGALAANKLAARWGAAGKSVRRLRPVVPEGQEKFDLNDVIRVEGGPVEGKHYTVEQYESLAAARDNAHGDACESDRDTAQTRRASLPEAYADVPQHGEDRLAQQVAAKHGSKIRFVEAWNKWFVWDGVIWSEAGPGRIVEEFVRDVCWRASDQFVRKNVKNKAVAASLVSAKTMYAVAKLAQSIHPVAASVNQWDADPWLLNTPAGVVDLRTGDMRLHRAEDYMTKVTTVAPGGDCPKWKEHLRKISADDEALVAYKKRRAGYMLTGVTSEHVLFFNHGGGRNGKSAEANVYAGVMGSYATTAAITTFVATPNEQHPTDLANLRGARLVRCSEVDMGQRWAEAKIKLMTGGDEISARFMRQDFFSYTPQFKLNFLGNHKPSLRSFDEAMKARFHLIPYTVTIPANERIKDFDKTLLAEEGPGILAWMIEGCLEWTDKGLNPPPCVVEASERYMREQDARGDWFDECYENCPSEFATVSSLMTSWTNWATPAGEYVGKRKELLAWLEARGFEKSQTRDGVGFKGIRVKQGAKAREPLPF